MTGCSPIVRAAGRPSVPGSVIAVVMVLQALEGCSDREAVERLRCDVALEGRGGPGHRR